MKKVLALAAGILFAAANLYAGNGDLIVNGNLGVGTTTPSTKLHIAGSGSVVSVGNFGAEMKLENAATVGDAGSASGFASNGSGASIGAWSNPITFYAGNNGSTKLERMRITENGYVGIGTTNPSQRLDVSGSIAIAEFAGIAPASFSHDPGHDNTIYFGQFGGSFGGIKVINYYDGSYNNQYLTFETHHGGVSAGERMRIDRDGNVGIGTTDPQGFKLFVNGDFKVEGYSYTKYGNWAGSDIRFKKDILPLEGSLDKVLKLSGVSYEWIDKDDKKDGLLESTNTEELDNKIEDKNKDFSEGRHFGVIAQDIEKIIPEAVKEDNDGYKAVNYAEIIPVLIEAIKEQQKQITAQQKEIEQLKEKVAQSPK